MWGILVRVPFGKFISQGAEDMGSNPGTANKAVRGDELRPTTMFKEFLLFAHNGCNLSLQGQKDYHNYEPEAD